MDSLITDMLIVVYFEPDEVAQLPSGVQTELFSELMRASRLGHHRVVISRRLGSWIEAHVSLSEIDRAHIVRLKSEYAQIAGLIPSARVLAHVVLGEGLGIEEGGRVIRIGHETLLNGRFLQKTVLLLENAASDGRMLQEIFSHEAKRRSFGEFSFFIANGGGSGTATELKRFVDDGYFVVCVCDSDILVPGGARSATCNQVMAAADRLTVPGVVKATPCREIENFLPLDVLELLYGDSRADVCSSVRDIFINQKAVKSDECVWLYLDLKLGIPKGRLRLICNTADKLAWVSAKFGLTESDLNDFELGGFGEDIVNRFLDSGMARAEFHRFTRSDYWLKHFSFWLETVLWGMCARKEIRTG